MSPQVGSLIVSTLTNGATIALIAVGFVMIFRATKVVSFAQGALLLVGAQIFVSLTHVGLGLYPSLILSIASDGLIGAACYRFAFARIVGSEPFITAVATIGLAYFVEACAIMIWGSAPLVLPPLFSVRSFHLFKNLIFNEADIFTLIVAAVTFSVLALGVQRTRTGLRMRMVADNPRLAAFSGINVVAISMLAWALAGGTAAVAGITFSLTVQPAPSDLYALGLLAFPAILLGGFDSILGALVGAFALALTEGIVNTYIGGNWQDVISYCLLLAVLVVRPQGLFGTAEVERV